jgi:hypothetical protein
MEMHPTAYDDSNISEQMLSELAQLFFAETIFTFSHDELCDLAEFLRRRLYYGGIPCEDHVRWIELRADCSCASTNVLDTPNSQLRLRSVLLELVEAHCKNFTMLIRFQQRPSLANMNYNRLELQRDFGYLTQPLWELHYQGIHVDLAFGNRKFSASAAFHPDQDVDTRWQIYKHYLCEWIEVSFHPIKLLTCSLN